jgi:hypothetical protein
LNNLSLASTRAARQTVSMTLLKWLGICCLLITACVCIGIEGGVLIGAFYGRGQVQGIPGHGAGYVFAGYILEGGITGARIGLVAGLLLAVAGTAIVTNKRGQ